MGTSDPTGAARQRAIAGSRRHSNAGEGGAANAAAGARTPLQVTVAEEHLSRVGLSPPG